MKMISWRQWKLGAAVAIFCALLTAGASYKHGMHFGDFIPVFCVACATTFGTFLINHPTDEVSFNAETLTKQQTDQDKKP